MKSKTPSAGATSLLFRIRSHPFVISSKLTRPMQRLVDMGFIVTKRRGFRLMHRTHLELTQTGRDYLSLFDTPPPWQPKQPPARSPRAEKKGLARDRRRPMDES